MRNAQAITVGLISLGCAKNLVDTEVMAERLARNGFVLSANPQKADVALINTCAFIRDAQEESVDAILHACAQKQHGRYRFVVVAGCLPQRYRKQIQKLLPEVDAFLGIDEIGTIDRVLRRMLKGAQPIAQIAPQARLVCNPPAHRLVLTGAPYAYLKIAEGCNHGCRFCAIPMIRGRYRSRSIANIVREAEGLLEQNIRELNLVAQDSMSYGCDLGARANLPALLHALGRLQGQFWVRILYGYPAGVSEALLQAMGSVRQVCQYLDVPLQHSAPSVLQAMGRSGMDAKKMIRRIRAILPNAILRTTFLIGFPGETKDAFQNLLAFIEEMRFDHVAAFVYSREEGTAAARLRQTVAAGEAQERRRILLEQQRRIVAEKARARIGQTDEVLIDKPAAQSGQWLARSRGQAPEADGIIKITASRQRLATGMFARVCYTGIAGYDMRAASVRPLK